MVLLSLAWVWLRVWLALAVLPALFFSMFWGGWGSAIAGIFSGLVLVCGCFFVEAHLKRVLLVRNKRDLASQKSLSDSLKRVLQLEGASSSVRALVYSDPDLGLYLGRSWGSHGTLYLSDGALGAWSESELRTILSAAVTALRAPGRPLQGFCEALAWGISQGVPLPNLLVRGSDLSRAGWLQGVRFFAGLILESWAEYFRSCAADLEPIQQKGLTSEQRAVAARAALLYDRVQSGPWRPERQSKDFLIF